MAAAIEADREARQRDIQVLRDLKNATASCMEDMHMHRDIDRMHMHRDLDRMRRHPSGIRLTDIRFHAWRNILHLYELREPQATERLHQLTAAELLAAVPPAVRRTLEALGLVEVAAAELQRMLQPNNDAAESAVAAGIYYGKRCWGGWRSGERVERVGREGWERGSGERVETAGREGRGGG